MTKNEFYETVTKKVEEVLDDVIVEVSEVKKVKVSLDGLIIRKKDEAIALTIYLNPYFTQFHDGREVDDIVDDIIRVYENNRPDLLNETFHMSDFYEFDKLKEKIVLKVINTEKNKELLQEVPHLDMDGLSLSVVFYVELIANEKQSASILIKNEHMKVWGCKVSELLPIAEENTNRMHAFTIMSLNDIMKQEFLEKGLEITDEEMRLFEAGSPALYVLTDQYKTFGASQLYLKDAIRTFAEKENSDVYILPSSIHELLLLRADFPNIEPDYLKNMVCEINATEVSESDFLYDGAFQYLLSEDKMIAL